MKWTSQMKPNVFFYVGIIVVVLNAGFLNFNFPISLAGTALIFFSDTIANSMNNYLTGNH